jgi:MFS family permease
MYSNIKSWLKENKEITFLIVAVVVAFLIYSSFYLSLPPKFNSPDETANYFFAKLYADNGILRVLEPLNFVSEGRAHPRSTAAVGGYIVPGGFLGIILLYGWLAKIFGLKIIFILTPLFACLAVFCFYEIIKKIFNSRIALWSSLLLLVHPAFWYYSARGLFPNVLFVSLLIFGFYFLICQEKLIAIGENAYLRKWGGYINYILAGLFFGLALTVRLSEIIWIGGALFLLFIVYKNKVNWRQVALFLIFAVLTFSPIFSYNQIFYESPFLTAYNLSDEQTGGSVGGNGVGWLLSFGRYVFPFGLHFKNILKNFSSYFTGMFWWLAIPLTIGVSWQIKKFIDRKLDKKIQIYLFLCFFVSLFLFIYYGSWLFYDNPAKEVSIGTSYTRYWLPIYILSLPLVAFSLIKFVDWFSGKQKRAMAAVLCLIIFLLSFKLTYFDKNDGLSVVARNVKEYAAIAKEVHQIVESDAVIIVDRADKIFFPEYRIIWPLRDPVVYDLIPDLAKLVPLYYYGVTLPQKDINYLYAKKLDPKEVEIVKIRDFGAETLYRLESGSRNHESGK